MIIVFTNPSPILNEHEQINEMFEEGLVKLHVKKNDFDLVQMKNWMQQINTAYYNRIVLHGFQELTDEFGIKNIHFSEEFRKRNSTIHFKNEFKYSTSIHNVNYLEDIHSNYNYVFLGPVFESISKPNYKSKEKLSLSGIEKKTKIIGIGGIDSKEKIDELKSRNFDGAALLGGIWNNSNALNQFKELNSAWN